MLGLICYKNLARVVQPRAVLSFTWLTLKCLIALYEFETGQGSLINEGNFLRFFRT